MLQIDDFWLDTVDIGHLLQVAIGSLVVPGAETGFGFGKEWNECSRGSLQTSYITLTKEGLPTTARTYN